MRVEGASIADHFDLVLERLERGLPAVECDCSPTHLDHVRRCSFPGCPNHGAALDVPVTFACKGRPILIQRLCRRHRQMIGHPSLAAHAGALS